MENVFEIKPIDENKHFKNYINNAYIINDQITCLLDRSQITEENFLFINKLKKNLLIYLSEFLDLCDLIQLSFTNRRYKAIYFPILAEKEIFLLFKSYIEAIKRCIKHNKYLIILGNIFEKSFRQVATTITFLEKIFTKCYSCQLLYCEFCLKNCSGCSSKICFDNPEMKKTPKTNSGIVMNKCFNNLKCTKFKQKNLKRTKKTNTIFNIVRNNLDSTGIYYINNIKIITNKSSKSFSECKKCKKILCQECFYKKDQFDQDNCFSLYEEIKNPDIIDLTEYDNKVNDQSKNIKNNQIRTECHRCITNSFVVNPEGEYNIRKQRRDKNSHNLQYDLCQTCGYNICIKDEQYAHKYCASCQGKVCWIHSEIRCFLCNNITCFDCSVFNKIIAKKELYRPNYFANNETLLYEEYCRIKPEYKWKLLCFLCEELLSCRKYREKILYKK